jgi:hypothetical protein
MLWEMGQGKWDMTFTHHRIVANIMAGWANPALTVAVAIGIVVRVVGRMQYTPTCACIVA